MDPFEFSKFMSDATDFSINTFSGGAVLRLGENSCPCVLGGDELTASLLGNTDQFLDAETMQVMARIEDIRGINQGEIPVAETDIMIKIPGEEGDSRWSIGSVRAARGRGESVVMDVSRVG